MLGWCVMLKKEAWGNGAWSWLDIEVIQEERNGRMRNYY